MKRLFLYAVISMFVVCLYGQEQVKMRVTGHEDINQLLGESRFLFPEFRDAQVLLVGEDAQAKMNYNLLADEMQFIDEKGDTLALKNKKDVTTISFGNRVFKYSPVGFTEVLAKTSSGNPELEVKRTIKEAGRENYGAYGPASAVASIENRTGTGYGNLNPIYASQEITYQKKDFRYLNSSGKYLIANRSGFLTVFSDKKETIEHYLKQNPVDYNSEEDVIRLFDFCTEK